ncbi:hypothetical protein Tco_0598823 [Tanacetum coccineum]
MTRDGQQKSKCQYLWPSTQGLLDAYGYNTIEEYLSWNYFPSTNNESTDMETTNKRNIDKDCIVDSNSGMSKEDIKCNDSYDSNLNESTFLVTPLSDSNEDEFFSPSDDIKFLLHRDPSTPKISVVSILEGFTDEPPLEENDDLFDLESKTNDWKKILYDAPINDLIFDARGDIGEIDTFLTPASLFLVAIL